MGRSRTRKPRNSATFRLCPRPGAADASDRVLVRVDGDPSYLPGFADDEYDGYDGTSSSADVGGYDGERSYSSSADGALPDHVRREILELGLPDDGYNYLAHIREFRPSFSSTGGGVSSAAFIPRRRPARSGLPVSVKAYDARSVEVGADNVAAAAVVAPIEQVIDPDVTKLLEENDVLQGAWEDAAKLPEESNVQQGTSEDGESEGASEDGELEEGAPEDGELEEGASEDGKLEEGTSEDEELEEDFVIIANQPEEEEQMDLEDDFVILANQPGEGVQMHTMQERLEGAWSMLAEEKMEMLSAGTKKAQKGFAGSSLYLV